DSLDARAVLAAGGQAGFNAGGLDFEAPRPGRRLRHPWRSDADCDGDFLAGAQKVRSPAAHRDTKLLPRNFHAPQPQSPGHSAHPGALRGDLLGPVAAELLFLGPSVGKNGPPLIRDRMAAGPDSDCQPNFHPDDAAAVLVRGLSGVREDLPS